MSGKELYTRGEVVDLLAEQIAEDELRRRFELREQQRLQQFGALQSEIHRRTAIPAQNEAQAEVTAYRAERIAELRDPRPETDHFGIVPELIDLVQGTTTAEVDASVDLMIAKTRSIVAAVQEAQR